MFQTWHILFTDFWHQNNIIHVQSVSHSELNCMSSNSASTVRVVKAVLHEPSVPPVTNLLTARRVGLCNEAFNRAFRARVMAPHVENILSNSHDLTFQIRSQIESQCFKSNLYTSSWIAEMVQTAI